MIFFLFLIIKAAQSRTGLVKGKTWDINEIPSAWFHPDSPGNISERIPFMQKCQYLIRTHLENFSVMERYKYPLIA